jgi:hypothetical protein
MTNQYTRPGSANIPIAVNDVVLITTPEGTLINTGLGGGTDGAQGTQGTTGTQGVQGTRGTQGTTGTGTQGTQGTTGTGTQGVAGPQGPQGEPGASGADLDSTDDLVEGVTNKYFTVERVSYEHTQGIASDAWVIEHFLGFKPNVTVVDSAGNIVEGEITYTNTNSLTVSFQSAFSGYAYIS